MSFDWAKDYLIPENTGLSGSGIKIALIDTGFDKVGFDKFVNVQGSADIASLSDDEVEKIQGSPLDKLPGIIEELKFNEVETDIDGSHGSNVSTIIGGAYGIADSADMYVAKVFRSTTLGEGHHLATRIAIAIYWALSQDVHIINISLAVNLCSKLLHRAVQQAYDQNTIVVCGTGNTPKPNSIAYPAAFQRTFAIGSMGIIEDDLNGELIEYLSPDSDYGQLLDFVSPGVNIKPRQDTGFMHGTSFATAYFTGTLALFFKEHFKINSKRINYSDLKQILINHSSRQMTDNQHHIKWGYGVVTLKTLMAHFDPKAKEIAEKHKELLTNYK